VGFSFLLGIGLKFKKNISNENIDNFFHKKGEIYDMIYTKYYIIWRKMLRSKSRPWL
jgi:hypothetical protein